MQYTSEANNCSPLTAALPEGEDESFELGKDRQALRESRAARLWAAATAAQQAGCSTNLMLQVWGQRKRNNG